MDSQIEILYRTVITMEYLASRLEGEVGFLFKLFAQQLNEVVQTLDDHQE